jgi:hypothetical protein
MLTMEVATPVPKTDLPTPSPAERAFHRTTAPQQVQPARTTELPEGFQQCALPTAAPLPRETVGRTRIVPPESTEDVFRLEAAVTWRAPTTSASRTRTARATYLASVATRHRAPTATGASAAAIAALTTTAAPEATAHQASSPVAFECARWPVIRQRTAMRERQRCPVRAARVVARATSAVRQTTPARTTASVPETVPAPTSPTGVGPASHAEWCLEATAAVLRIILRIILFLFVALLGADVVRLLATLLGRWLGPANAFDGSRRVFTARILASAALASVGGVTAAATHATRGRIAVKRCWDGNSSNAWSAPPTISNPIWLPLSEIWWTARSSSWLLD